MIPFMLPLLIAGGTPCKASILFLENFETDGLGARYLATGMFSDGVDDYFTRTDGATEASGIPAYTGFGGSWFWAVEDMDATENTTGVALLDFPAITIGASPAIRIGIDIGAGSNSVFDILDDFLLVQYRFDGGPWQTALAFQNNGQTYNGPLLNDTDFDGIGDTTQLGLQLQTVSSGLLPVTGSVLDLRIDSFFDSGFEAVAFDNITVTGVPEPAAAALASAAVALLLSARRRFLPRWENESRA